MLSDDDVLTHYYKHTRTSRKHHHHHHTRTSMYTYAYARMAQKMEHKQTIADNMKSPSYR